MHQGSARGASDKQRFELSPDGKRIRARQGHSIPVQGDWPIAPPPGMLFHGTSERFLASILKRGLLPAARHHVHLSSTVEIARAVSARRGQSIVLEVAASKMAADGFTFRLSSNGVWLTDHVPPIYLGEIPRRGTRAPHEQQHRAQSGVTAFVWLRKMAASNCLASVAGK